MEHGQGEEHAPLMHHGQEQEHAPPMHHMQQGHAPPLHPGQEQEHALPMHHEQQETAALQQQEQAASIEQQRQAVSDGQAMHHGLAAPQAVQHAQVEAVHRSAMPANPQLVMNSAEWQFYPVSWLPLIVWWLSLASWSIYPFILKSSYIFFSRLCHVETAPLSNLQTWVMAESCAYAVCLFYLVKVCYVLYSEQSQQQHQAWTSTVIKLHCFLYDGKRYMIMPYFSYD